MTYSHTWVGSQGFEYCSDLAVMTSLRSCDAVRLDLICLDAVMVNRRQLLNGQRRQLLNGQHPQVTTSLGKLWRRHKPFLWSLCCFLCFFIKSSPKCILFQQTLLEYLKLKKKWFRVVTTTVSISPCLGRKSTWCLPTSNTTFKLHSHTHQTKCQLIVKILPY